VGKLLPLLPTLTNAQKNEDIFKKPSSRLPLKKGNPSQVSANRAILPLLSYVIHAAQICELALDGKTTPKNVKSKLDDIYSHMDIVEKYAIGQRSPRANQPAGAHRADIA
jgi:hypothetical protein